MGVRSRCRSWFLGDSIRAMAKPNIELLACTPAPIVLKGFNPQSDLPYGLTTGQIAGAMGDFITFLGFINRRLHAEKIPRLESIMMSANFSSLVGEFMNASIPKYCSKLDDG